MDAQLTRSRVDSASRTIKRVDSMRVALPLAKPMTMAGVRIETADNVLVRIEAADGMTGWGEATSAPTMTGDLAESMLAAIDYLSPLLVGSDAADHAVLTRRCHAAMHGNPGAKSAIDMALLDLVGRMLGAPTVELLGGALHRRMPSMWLLGNSSTAEDAEEAMTRNAEGLTIFKLKVGVKRIEEEIELARVLRRQLGPDVMLCADANMGFTRKAARYFLHGIDQLDLAYLEQPLRPEDMEGAAELQSLGSCPICGDESIGTSQDVLSLARAGAMGGINLKLLKAGGPSAAIRMASLCEQLGLSMTIAGKIAESSISAANTLAVACASATVDWGLNLTNIYLADDLVKAPLALEDGSFELPDGAGSGVEVDEAAVERYRVDR